MAWHLSEHIPIEAVRELVSESPRAAAIVGAAIIEAQLSILVEAAFPVEGDTKKELFREAGPLGSYDIKIKLAYVLGIISKTAKSDLTLIGRIRNKFAHQLKVVSFDDPIIKPMCMDLKLIERHVFELGTNPPDNDEINTKFFEPDLLEKLPDPRQRYLITTRIVTSTLLARSIEVPRRPILRALI